MSYSIGEISEKLHLPTSTLRYYDKEGLLPDIERSKTGARRFRDKDVTRLQIIHCLKSAGLSIREIRHYIALVNEGDTSIRARHAIFRERRARLAQQMQELQDVMDMLDFKCWYYERAEAAGTTHALDALPDGTLPKKFKKIYQSLYQLAHTEEP